MRERERETAALDFIHKGDCLEYMKLMPDASIDAIVTSPPYNICLRVHSGKYTHRSSGEERAGLNVNKYTNGLSDSLEMDEYYRWQCDCIDEMMRVSKGPIFYNIQPVTGNKVAVFQILGKYAENIREVLIWDKMSAEPAIGARCLNSEFEFIIVFDKGDCKGRQFKTFNAERGTLSNVLRISKNNKSDGSHRAAFPLLLPQTLIHYFTKEGDIILDPFLGSGTTAVACIKEKRHYIGIEKDAKYFKMAQIRIDAEKRQLSLF